MTAVTRSISDLFESALIKAQVAEKAERDADAALLDLGNALGATGDVEKIRLIAAQMPRSAYHKLRALADQLECGNLKPTDFVRYSPGDRVKVNVCTRKDPGANALVGKETTVLMDMGEEGVHIASLDGKDGFVFSRRDIAPA
jgi:hypothetical protein